MIRVEAITIREFRGIRDITLNLGSRNFAVCGPNGTGKSGVVDALEFGLTGNISRLSGSGTGGLSVKEHGPHVDSSKEPEKASVVLSISLPSLGKQVTIERTVKSPRDPKITPDDGTVRALLHQVVLHPEFTLSRRELIRYVLSEPGKRAKEVQALLRLEDLETLRATLQRIANAEEKGLHLLGHVRREARDRLSQSLGITELSPENVLAAVNKHRAVLVLPPLTVLEATTRITEDLATAPDASALTRVPKTQALADLGNLREELEVLSGEDSGQACKLGSESVSELGKDAASLDGLAREDLLQSALKLFDEHTCPVCGTGWEPEKFKAVVAAKLKHFDDVKVRRVAVEAQLTPIANRFDRLVSTLALVANYGQHLSPPVDVQALRIYAAALTNDASQLRRLLPLSETQAVLSGAATVPPDVLSAVDALEKSMSGLPEPSQQDAARDFLTIGQERLEIYRQASIKLKTAKQRETNARTVLDLYSSVTTQALDEIYKMVEQRFIEFYRAINSDDEGAFEAQLKPSMGKLGFETDFYGRGFFPPGAYHSEGHQDAMGLCLYLALMSHLLGDRFTFSVLDDVLMSVDTGHRRNVSKLLSEKFPNTQFVVTTHDEIWMHHMKAEGLIQPAAFVHFRTWNVESGPRQWDEVDVWGEIYSHLAGNDVSQAAAMLRHYLEHMTHEICHRLRARVEFRADTQFMLGDLLPPAIDQMRRLLKKGKNAAQSWGQKEKMQIISDFEREFSSIAQRSNAEKWQVNAAVHYNKWASLQKEDFEPVADSFRDLMKKFHCNICNSVLRVMPERGSQDSLRCACGEFAINLVQRIGQVTDTAG